MERLRRDEKTCPFVARECLQGNCMAWEEGCRLIPGERRALRPFEDKIRNAAPLMYRSLLDLVKIMEEASRSCGKCGPDLWNSAQEVRNGLLDDLIAAELAEVGIRAEE
jgi:hypothetical protein